MEINGLVISDIHFGAMKAPELYMELEKVFIKKINVMEKLDVVFIAGDLFEKKLSFNEEHARYAIKFITQLCNLAKEKKFKIRILRGTRNHDLHQLNNFQYLEQKNEVDFRIINVVTEEDMFGEEFKVLYVPEEYMEEPDEYYKDTLYNDNKHYDLIIGHGEIEFQSFENLRHQSERKIANAPSFKNKVLLDKATLTVFGHIHNRCNYNERLYYCGSFSRWKFGEEDPKGFIVFKYRTSDKKFALKYVDNTLAKEYKTISLNDIMKDEELDITKKIDIIKEIKEKSDSDFVKFKYSVDESNSEENQIIKNYFAENEDIIISSKKEQLKVDDSEKELLKEYEFIFNKKYDFYETVSMYVEKKGKKLPVDRVKELINNEL